eukprot:996565_1
MTTFSSHNRAENCWMQCRAQPWTYYMALVLLLISYLCCVVALPINRLGTVTVNNNERTPPTEWESYCGWNHLEHGATIHGVPSKPLYSKYCATDAKVFCDESKKGKQWLAMGLTSIIVGLFAWVGILR